MMQRWDFFTLSALFFTATVTPYEVCLMWEETTWETPSPRRAAALHRQLDCESDIHVDMGFNFFLPYRESTEGGALVKSHKRIARRYLKTWFFIDLVSVIPVDNIMMSFDTSGCQTRRCSHGRMLRLLRLIKLARILRASRIFSRWENSISISSAAVPSAKPVPSMPCSCSY